MNKLIHAVFAATLSLGALSGAWAAGDAKLTAAEVRKVDAAKGQVTLKHERIENLDMAPMTMVFRATKPEQLKGLKTGDKVKFRAETDKGAMVVTHIESAK